MPPLEGPALGHFLAARAGKLTGSRMRAAMSFLKNGAPSSDRNNLMRDLLAERLTGESVPHYVNPAMQWGLDHEDDMKAAYEAETELPPDAIEAAARTAPPRSDSGAEYAPASSSRFSPWLGVDRSLAV